MRNLTRRKFVTDMATGAASVSLAATGPRVLASENSKPSLANGISVVIPMPIQVVIDDVGWWSGKDGSEQQEPFRTGINRNHTVADYKAIVELGRALNIRPMAATILCEWDRSNTLRKLPNITWMGEKWDNSQWVGPWLDEAADVIRNNQAHYELTLHGVGHEFWIDGVFSRAEWATLDGTMRSRQDVEVHLGYFEEIMAQNHLGDFPKSFVPTCFNHGFGRTGNHDVSIAELLKQRGIEHINTPFSNMQNAKDVQYGKFGLDSGIMTVDRGADILDWNTISTGPAGKLTGPICGMHWPNLLHEKPERNSEIVNSWVQFLRPYDAKQETLLAKDSRSFQHQLVHHICSRTKQTNNAIEIDFTHTNKLDTTLGKSDLTVKVKSPSGIRFFAQGIQISSETSSKNKSSIMYTLSLQRQNNGDRAHIRFERNSTG